MATMTNTFPKGEARIGPSCWRDDTKHEVKVGINMIFETGCEEVVTRLTAFKNQESDE